MAIGITRQARQNTYSCHILSVEKECFCDVHINFPIVFSHFTHQLKTDMFYIMCCGYKDILVVQVM